MRQSSILKLITITPIFMVVTNYLAIFPHEYAHSFLAWFLGYKKNTFAINYGGTSWLNIFLLFNIDENVNYDLIVSQGHLYHMAWIALLGPIIVNGLLYLISLFLLSRRIVHKHPMLFYFLFWFNFMNLARLYAYVPIRTFSTQGDISHIVMGLGISPWFVYIVLGYLIAFFIWYFFTHTLIQTFHHLKLTTATLQASLMVVSNIVFFGYFGMAGFIGYGEISHFLSATSFLLIPGALIVCWPTRAWVKRRFMCCFRQI